MCQKRSGWPRSTISNAAQRMISGNASTWPSRIVARSFRSPNRSSKAAAKYTPPVTPPKKKYRTIHQPQFGTWNEGLKSAGMLAGLLGRFDRIDASFAHGQHTRDARQDGGDQAQPAAGRQVAAGQVGRLGQAVGRGCVFEQVERVESAQHRLVAPVQPRLCPAGLLQLLQAGVGTLLQGADGSELNRRGRAGLRAGRRPPRLEPVVGE